MLLALPFFWPNYANFYALLAEKCSLMLEILNSNSVKHDLTINLITMAEYVPGMAAKIAGTLSYECIPTRKGKHHQKSTGTFSCTCTAPVRWKPNCIFKILNNFASMALCQKFEESALYVGGKCSKKLAMLKKILILFMSENAKNYAGLFYRWLLSSVAAFFIFLQRHKADHAPSECS